MSSLRGSPQSLSLPSIELVPPVGGYVEYEDVDGLRDYSINFENLRRYLNTRFNFDVEEGGIILALDSVFLMDMASVLAWFCASGSEDDSDDLYFAGVYVGQGCKPVSVDQPIKVP